MNLVPIRVVKVGGSLFDFPNLTTRLHAWLDDQAPAHHVLLAGGGALVDQVREWRAMRPLSDSAAHWMCVDLLTVTACCNMLNFNDHVTCHLVTPWVFYTC